MDNKAQSGKSDMEKKKEEFKKTEEGRGGKNMGCSCLMMWSQRSGGVVVNM